MSLAVWSYLLAAINIGGLVLSWQVGNRKRWAWLFYVPWNLIWIAYAIDTGSYGFIASASAYIAVALRNWLKWAERPAIPTGEPTA
jgi:hypothetical protein